MVIRPHCVICGFDKSATGGGVRFANYAPPADDYSQHGPIPGNSSVSGFEMFCDDHLPRAMQLSHLSSDEALAVMRGERPPRPGGKAGIASLILGLLGLFTMIICIGAGLGPAALVAGVVSRRQARRHGAPTPGTAIAGIALGVLCVILTIVGMLWLRFLAAHPDPFACWPMKHHAGCY